METGWVRPTTASTVTSPDMDQTPGQDSMAVDPLLQQDALQDADVAHQLYNPAIPQNPPPEHGMDMDDENPLMHITQTPVLPREDEPLPPAAHAGMMAGVAANTSNAFEGALESSSFVGLNGLGGLEPFSMDSSSWYTGDWMDPDPSRNGGIM